MYSLKKIVKETMLEKKAGRSLNGGSGMRDKRNRSDEETQIKASNYQKVRSKSV
jgi:hypothetical protein